MELLSKGIAKTVLSAVTNGVQNSSPYALPTVATLVEWQTIFGTAPASVTILIQTSTDNSNWTTAATSTATAGESGNFVTAALFIRARCSAVSGGSTTTVILVPKQVTYDISTTIDNTVNNPAGSQHDVQLNGGSNAFGAVANGTTGKVLTANTGADPTWEDPSGSGITQLTGDVTAGPGSGSQVTAIAAGVIVNADINAAAAIAWNKLAVTPTPLVVGGIPLIGAKFVRKSNTNLPTGDTDLYTVPANKRAIVQSVNFFNNSAGQILVFPEAKVSGTYYKLQATATVNAGASSTLLPSCILEAGEIFSLNAATTSGGVVNVNIIEFDNTSPVTRAAKFGTSTGDQTVYTCPAGKTAIVCVNLTTPTQGVVGYIVGAGGSLTYILNLVPFGDSPAATNQLAVGVAIGTGVRTFLTNQSPVTLEAGDFLNLNASTGDAAAVMMAPVVELTL